MIVDGGDDLGDDSGSGSDSEGNTKSSALPMSEVVDGWLVLNVRVEAAVDGGEQRRRRGRRHGHGDGPRRRGQQTFWSEAKVFRRAGGKRR